MKIAITADQYKKLEHELFFHLDHAWELRAALHVAVTQNSIFSMEEQWVLPEFVRAWLSEESGVTDLETPLTEQYITQFLTKFVILNEETHST